MAGVCECVGGRGEPDRMAGGQDRTEDALLGNVDARAKPRTSHWLVSGLLVPHQQANMR